MLETMQVTWGSTAGAKHRRGTLASSQDFVLGARTKSAISVVVCDGASKAPQSQYGATMLANATTKHVQAHAATGGVFDQYTWSDIQLLLVEEIEAGAAKLYGNRKQVLIDHFMATIVGMVVTEHGATWFWIGDGGLFDNGEYTKLEPTQGNRPVFLAYALTGSPVTDGHPELLQFQTRHRPLAEFNHGGVASDGIGDFIAAANKTMPGGAPELVGPVSQFWEDDAYYGSAGAVSNKLNCTARDLRAINLLTRGRLSDDTSIGIVRRRKDS